MSLVFIILVGNTPGMEGRGEMILCRMRGQEDWGVGREGIVRGEERLERRTEGKDQHILADMSNVNGSIAPQQVALRHAQNA